MTANIKAISLWHDNPDKSRLSRIVRVDFHFPCTWTVLSIADLKNILRLWIKGEETRYPISKGFRGRWMLFDEIKKVFEEKKENDLDTKCDGKTVNKRVQEL